MSSGYGTHLLVFPYPTSGLIIPIIDLTHTLLLLLRNLTITFLVTPPNLHLLQPLLSLFPPPSLTPLVLSSADDLHLKPPPTHKLRATSRILALRTLRDPIFHWFRSHPSPPVGPSPSSPTPSSLRPISSLSTSTSSASLSPHPVPSPFPSATPSGADHLQL